MTFSLLTTLVMLAAHAAPSHEKESFRITVTGEGGVTNYSLERQGARCHVSRKGSSGPASWKTLPSIQFDAVMEKYGWPVLHGLRRDPVPTVKDCTRFARVAWSGLSEASGMIENFCLRPREASGVQGLIEYLNVLASTREAP